jgi:hypothetical protein
MLFAAEGGSMLTLAVIAIFCAMVAIVVWSSNKSDDRSPRPIRVRHDEQSRHHRRNLPGPGAE